jgi:hypothetical protein
VLPGIRRHPRLAGVQCRFISAQTHLQGHDRGLPKTDILEVSPRCLASASALPMLLVYKKSSQSSLMLHHEEAIEETSVNWSVELVFRA